jgi:hypothetical protein
MCKDVQHEQLNILLPASALDVLKDMTGGAFKVFIYLCSCNHGLAQARFIERPRLIDAREPAVTHGAWCPA